MSDARLRKTEKLKRRKVIQALFNRGEAVFAYPVRIQWLLTEKDGEFPVRAAFSVSRKKFKRAVDRNKVKRLMREGYRINKALLYSTDIPESLQLAIMLIYTPDEILPFDTIEKGIKKALRKLPVAYQHDET